jgi:alanine racemase
MTRPAPADLAPSFATIDLDAYAHNLRVVRDLSGPDAKILAVVKANAYGHGLVPVARKAVATGAAMLGVATVDEGVTLRDAGITAPVVVLFQPAIDALPAVVEYGLTLVLADRDTAEHLGEIARKANRVVPVHCQIDSGMGRQGFDIESAANDIQFLTRISHIDIEGLCTHFPIANKKDDEFTLNQVRAFKNVAKQLERAGIPFEMVHAANSAGIVNYPKSAFDMVRPGIMAYGVWPADDTPAQNPLRPVLRWETSVTQVRELEAGANISYGRTYTAASRMRVAILPVGYADGYRHRLSNRAEVLIHGKRCPVRGSVCMDQTVVDITSVPSAKAGDTVVLIGEDRGQRITADELAAHANTIPYEILTGIGARVPRIYRAEV